MPLELPAGTRCFVDANIFYYHHVETPPFSEACSAFLARLSQGDVEAATAAHVLAEAIHKIMLAEAVQRFGLDRSGLVRWLREHRSQVHALSVFRAAAEQLCGLPLALLPVDKAVLVEAATLSQQTGLLTNDALVLALMRRHQITHLVTNDEDFQGLSGVVVWKPG